jgi:galactokinase
MLWICTLTCDLVALIIQSQGPNDKKLSALGGLMSGSHVSCRDLYQCSCEELDQLVEVANKAGALGARLTGEGGRGVGLGCLMCKNIVHVLFVGSMLCSRQVYLQG